MKSLRPEQFAAWRDFRRELHAVPEVSGEEHQTAESVADRLRPLNPDAMWLNVGGTGVVALFDGAEAGETTLLRAELDGLPIEEWAEEAERPHRSRVRGKSHTCGHDGHATILLGVAESLSQERPQFGRILLLWQPAEENGKGAPAVCADSRWASEIPPPDKVFALHNLPGVPLGEIVTRLGSFTAAVRSLIVRFEGKTSHAAEPEHGLNPAAAMAEFTLGLLQRAVPERNRPDFSVVTPIHSEMGEVAYGVSAGAGTMRFTIRTWDEEAMLQWVHRSEQWAQQCADQHGLNVECSWTEVFEANENAPAAVACIEAAARANGWPPNRARYPFKWGEDFGVFTQRYEGAMFGLGAGMETPALHNPDYDFPDDLIERGVRIFLSILQQRHV